jgi:hypothetical protein
LEWFHHDVVSLLSKFHVFRSCFDVLLCALSILNRASLQRYLAVLSLRFSTPWMGNAAARCHGGNVLSLQLWWRQVTWFKFKEAEVLKPSGLASPKEAQERFYERTGEVACLDRKFVTFLSCIPASLLCPPPC